MDQYISRPDTDRFGFKVARINSFPEPVPLMVGRFRARGFKLIISRVPLARIPLINEMEQTGFRLRDVQVTYGFDLDRDLPPVAGTGCLYRCFRPGDAPAVTRIAARSFKQYGHYARIDLPGGVDTGEIYADWAGRCCRSRDAADYMVVAEDQGDIAGFLAFKTRQDQGTSLAVGVMGAVHEKYRSMGVFRDINIHGLARAKARGIRRVEHNVLVDNHPVNRTYSSLGFSIVHSEITMHCLL